MSTTARRFARHRSAGTSSSDPARRSGAPRPRPESDCPRQARAHGHLPWFSRSASQHGTHLITCAGGVRAQAWPLSRLGRPELAARVTFRPVNAEGRFRPLVAELKRRRVFRALIGYGIVGFAVLQIIEPVMHGLHWPDAVLSYIVVALAAGFPVVLMLAWIFDVNEGRNEDVATIAEKLHVATVLEGSVRKSGDQIRITTQLVNAADGYHLWSETYDRTLTDVFAVQDDIARSVVDALKLKLLEPPTSKHRRTASTEAYNEYLLGQQFFRRNNVEGFRRAMQAYEKAVALDPGYAPAWAALALATFWVADSADSLTAVKKGQ